MGWTSSSDKKRNAYRILVERLIGNWSFEDRGCNFGVVSGKNWLRIVSNGDL
jgi:hypothetical protein